MEILDVVMKLNGPIDPVGETHVDSKRLENLRALCDLTEKLLNDIESVTWRRDDHQASVKAAKAVAAAFLRSVQTPQDDVGADPRAAHEQLLFAVHRVFPGESRHETALRYIREAEASACESEPSAQTPKEARDA